MSMKLIKLKEFQKIQGGNIIGKNWKKDNNTLKIVITTNSKRLNVANIIKENLEIIGIETQIKDISDKYYKNNLQNINYDVLLTGAIISLKPDIDSFLEFEKNNKENMKETYEKIYEDFNNNPSFIGLYFDSIIIVHSKNLKGNFLGNWYNIFYNIDTWYKAL